MSAFKNTLPGVRPSGRLRSIPFRSRRNGGFPLWLPFAWTLSRIELATAKPAGPLSPAGPQEQRADQKPLPFLRVVETPGQTVGLPCQYPPFPAACPCRLTLANAGISPLTDPSERNYRTRFLKQDSPHRPKNGQ